jgi:hypothetical protein
LPLAACSPAETTPHTDDGRVAASLTQVDSVTLVEPDTLLLGRVSQGFDVDEGGDLYVAASSFGRIIRYSPAGRPIMSYGRFGSGPGEFRQVFPVVAVVDSVVFGSATMGRRVNIFHRETGASLAAIRFAGFLTTILGQGGKVHFGNFSRRDSSSVGVVSLDRLLARGRETDLPLQPTMAAIPREYVRFSELELSSDVRVAVRDHEVLAAFAPLGWMLRLNPSTGAADTVMIPARVRRGTSEAAFQAHFVKERHRIDQAVEAISLLEGIWTLPAGLVALIHMDSRVQMRGETPVSVTATPYLTLLSEDLDRACVDAKVPSHAESRPVVTIEGDLLYVLEQIVSEGPEPAASTVVRVYRIDASSCQWVPVDVHGKG